MEKYLVTIEFRYLIRNNNGWDVENCNVSDKVTIGIFEHFNEACYNGNKILESLENRFKLNVYRDGRTANIERLGESVYGSIKKTLVSDLGYLKTPFSFFLKVETLKCKDINEEIDSILKKLNN